MVEVDEQEVTSRLAQVDSLPVLYHAQPLVLSKILL